MQLIFIFINVFLLLILFKRWGVSEVLGSPPKFIFLANSAYFFLIFLMFWDDNKSEQYYAILCAALFLSSFVIADFFFNKKANYTCCLKSVKFLRPTRGVYLIYIVVVFIFTWDYADNFGTFNPIEAFSASYLKVSGVEKEGGSYLWQLIFTPILWFLFILAIYRGMHYGRFRTIKVAAILLLFTYLQAFSGSKSFVILPYLMWFFLWVRAQPNRHLYFPIFTALVFSMIVLYLLVYLNQIRGGYGYMENFLESFLNRVDFIPTLEGYLERHEYFSSMWPPFMFLEDFIPFQIAQFIGLDKHRVSFDVLYTQFAYNDQRISSSAGLGIAAMNETLRVFGLNFPMLASVLAGILASFLTYKFSQLLDVERAYKGIVFFASLVPALHIIAFFEPGPVLFFKLVFNLSLLLLFVCPIFKMLKIIRIERQ